MQGGGGVREGCGSRLEPELPPLGIDAAGAVGVSGLARPDDLDNVRRSAVGLRQLARLTNPELDPFDLASIIGWQRRRRDRRGPATWDQR